MANIPEDMQERLQHHLTAIGRLFKSPRVTLIVRGPELGNATGDLVLTTDDPLKAERALRARIIAQAKIFAGQPAEMDVYEKPATRPDLPMESQNVDLVLRPSGNNFRK